MENTISPEMVEEIVQSIFSTMLNIDLQTDNSISVPAADRMTSAVFLEGDWNGAVSLECSQRQACELAGHFLGSDPPDTANDDVRDVLGELANMIGGNIKSLIPGQIRLSMPSVIDGHDYVLRICGSAVADKVGFRFEGGMFWVTLLSSNADGGGASIDPRDSLQGAMNPAGQHRR